MITFCFKQPNIFYKFNRRMLKNLHQQKKKKILRLDSSNKFQSIISKQKVNQTKQNSQLIHYKLFQQQNTCLKNSEKNTNEQRQSRIIKQYPSSLKFKDLCTLHHLQSRKKKQKNLQQPIVQNLNHDQIIDNKFSRSSISLPSIKKEQQRLKTFNKIYYGNQQIKYEVIDELIEILKNKNIIKDEKQVYSIKRVKLEEILNFLMCLSKTTCKKKVPYIIQNFSQLSDLEQISMKIFNKIKDKKYYKKTNILTLNSCQISYQYAPEKEKQKKILSIKNFSTKKNLLQYAPEKEKKKTMLPIKNFKIFTTKTNLRQQCYSQSQSDSDKRKRATTYVESYSSKLQMQQTPQQLLSFAKEFQFSISEYSKLISSQEFIKRINQFYPFSSVEDELFEQMNDYYKNILNDNFLVPSLKQKLLNNLITKVCSSFKLNVKTYSISATSKIKEIQEWIQKINDYTQKYTMKIKNQLKMKALFMMDCTDLQVQLKRLYSKIIKINQKQNKLSEQNISQLILILTRKIKKIEQFNKEYK